MRKKDRPYVNDAAIELVSKLFTKEQEAHETVFVTKKQVYARITKAFVSDPKLQNKKKYSYRVMERAIERLCNKKEVKRECHGVYWLIENWKNRTEYRQNVERKMEVLKQEKKELLDEKKSVSKEKDELYGEIKNIKQEKIKLSKEKSKFEGGYNAGKHFLDALLYCDSAEDWALLEAFFSKMHLNKIEKDYLEEREELWDEEQERRAEIMEELEKKV